MHRIPLRVSAARFYLCGMTSRQTELCARRVYQLQALSAELLETFEFSLPEDKPRILRVPAAIMMPVVEGKLEQGAAMPLRVSLAP